MRTLSLNVAPTALFNIFNLKKKTFLTSKSIFFVKVFDQNKQLIIHIYFNNIFLLDTVMVDDRIYTQNRGKKSAKKVLIVPEQ